MYSTEERRGAAPRRSTRPIAAALARLWPSRDGATAVETALVLPAFLLLLLGVIELGRALYVLASLQYAVEAASRCAVIYASSTCDGTAATRTYAAAQVLGPSIPSGDFSVATSGTCGSGGSTTVSASYSFSFFVAHIFPTTLTLSAKSAYPC